jgi:hypothetical protein
LTGVLAPINIEETLELLQIRGFQSVIAEHKRKTLSDVAQLLAAQPVEGQGPDGQPQKQSSIPVDTYDNHEFVAQFLAVWMISSTGQDQKAKNPRGFENVELFWQGQQAAAQPPTPPGPPTVRTNLYVAAKLADMPPQFTQEIMGGANLGQIPAPEQPQPGELGVPEPAASEPGPGPIEQEPQQQPAMVQ